MKLKIFSFALLFFLLQSSYFIFSQQINIHTYKLNSSNTEPGLDLATGSFILLSAVNPLLLYENKKVYFGISREVTMGFGKDGEYRISAEYSFIFRRNLKHHLRFSAKYDILTEVSKSDWLDTRYLISLGAGYFLDADGEGIFPEVTAGVRLWEDKYIMIPYVKLRHTFMVTKNKPGNSDISLGMILGYRPF
jgi:hypothetical protein